MVANRNAQGSIGLARYYMDKRGVPEENLLRIFVTDKENCSRADFDQLIARRVREKLEEYSLAKRPRCVVTVKGVPLRIKALPLNKEEQSEIAGLTDERERLNGQMRVISDDAGKKEVSDALSAVEKKRSRHFNGRTIPVHRWIPN